MTSEYEYERHNKGPSVINDICEKTKTRRLGEGGFGQVRFLKKYRCAAGTAAECAALSSSLDAQHFHQVSMRSAFVKLRCAALSSSFTAPSAPTRPTMHSSSNTVTVASAARARVLDPVRNLCLASAACKTCNDDHILYSSFCLANYGFSSAPQKASHMCMDIISGKYRSCII